MLQQKLAQDISGFFWSRKVTSSQQRTFHASAFQFLIKHNKSSVDPSKCASKSYEWEKLLFITRWNSAHSSTVICLGATPDIRHRMYHALRNEITAGEIDSAQRLISVIVGRVVEEFDRAVWSWRHPIRELEASRFDLRKATMKYESMHELARHTMHCSEMLLTAISVVESMLQDAAFPTGDVDISFYLSILRALSNRSRALESRLQNEISLVSDVVSAANGGKGAKGITDLPCQRRARQFHCQRYCRGSSERWPDYESNWPSWNCLLTRDIH